MDSLQIEYLQFYQDFLVTVYCLPTDPLTVFWEGGVDGRCVIFLTGVLGETCLDPLEDAFALAFL